MCNRNINIEVCPFCMTLANIVIYFIYTAFACYPATCQNGGSCAARPYYGHRCTCVGDYYGAKCEGEYIFYNCDIVMTFPELRQ